MKLAKGNLQGSDNLWILWKYDGVLKLVSGNGKRKLQISDNLWNIWKCDDVLKLMNETDKRNLHAGIY